MMQGRLTVQSTPTQGSVFELDWSTVSQPLLVQPASSQPEIADAPVDRLRVLVAEDNPLNQTLICALLKRLGITPDLVDDGEAALDLLASKPYDLVLMDVQMPRLDGISATRELRKMRLAHQPRVIAVTANVLDDERVERLRALIVEFNKSQAKPSWPALIEAPVPVDKTMKVPQAPDDLYVYFSN